MSEGGSAAHEAFMAEAISEAKKRFGRTGPNPAVGAVFVRDGRVVARGHHHGAGSPHAEIEVLAECQRAGIDVTRGTLYVTLEPCRHRGRTGPCTEALLKAGVREVVFGCIDPNPKVSGMGAAMLRAARVGVLGPVLEDACRALIADFATSVREGRPYVVAKAGISLDGRVATKRGDAKWITSEASRASGRALRAQAQAIAVGIGTVLADDPALTVRDGKSEEPLRVVFDSKLRIPLGAKVLGAGAPGCVVITGNMASARKEKALLSRGVSVLRVPGKTVSMRRALRLLNERLGIIRLFVEGGPRVLGSLADAGMIDELHLYIAPVLFGGAAPMFLGGEGVAKIVDAERFLAPEIERVGDDVHLRYVKKTR